MTAGRRPENAFTTRDYHVRAWFKQGAGPPARASARYRYPRSNGGAGPPGLGASARCRWQRVALTCEVCGDPVRTTFSRPVVTTVLTTVPAHTTKRDHMHDEWFTGRRPSSLGRQPQFRCLGSAAMRQPDIDGTVVAPTCEVGGDPSGPRSHDPWSRPRRPWHRAN